MNDDPQLPEQPDEQPDIEALVAAAGLKRISAYVPDGGRKVTKKAQAKRRERAARAAAGARPLTIESVPDELRPFVLEAVRAAMRNEPTMPQTPPPPAPTPGQPLPWVIIGLATAAGMVVGAFGVLAVA